MERCRQTQRGTGRGGQWAGDPKEGGGLERSLTIGIIPLHGQPSDPGTAP